MQPDPELLIHASLSASHRPEPRRSSHATGLPSVPRSGWPEADDASAVRQRACDPRRPRDKARHAYIEFTSSKPTQIESLTLFFFSFLVSSLVFSFLFFSLFLLLLFFLLLLLRSPLVPTGDCKARPARTRKKTSQRQRRGNGSITALRPIYSITEDPPSHIDRQSTTATALWASIE
jgi:hypothetical protein